MICTKDSTVRALTNHESSNVNRYEDLCYEIKRRQESTSVQHDFYSKVGKSDLSYRRYSGEMMPIDR